MAFVQDRTVWCVSVCFTYSTFTYGFCCLGTFLTISSYKNPTNSFDTDMIIIINTTIEVETRLFTIGSNMLSANYTVRSIFEICIIACSTTHALTNKISITDFFNTRLFS